MKMHNLVKNDNSGEPCLDELINDLVSMAEDLHQVEIVKSRAAMMRSLSNARKFRVKFETFYEKLRTIRKSNY